MKKNWTETGGAREEGPLIKSAIKLLNYTESDIFNS